MNNEFHLEKVGQYNDSGLMSGYGMFNLFNTYVEYCFNELDISLNELEKYIQNVLNNLLDKTIDEICRLAYEWKEDKMSSDTMDYPIGLNKVWGRDILKFMQIGTIEIYRNPYDKNDNVLGAVLVGSTDWDTENGMEIIIRGKEVLEVREFLGYEEYSIWNTK